VVVVVSILNLTSDFLPFPVSRIVKAIGVAVAGIVIMYIVTLVWDSPADSLLLPNLLLFGARSH
jgi:FtsH-binding integral membrane protein